MRPQRAKREDDHEESSLEDEQAATPLPNREAMFLVGGLAPNSVIPPELLGGSDLPLAGDLMGTSQTAAPVDPTAVPDPNNPMEIDEQAPANEATTGNIGSTGSAEGATVTQEAPTNQG